MAISNALTKLLKTLEANKTVLGVGPVSKNVVDVVLEICDTYNVPMMLIPSRRQIEAKSLGGGYVNNWTTEDFSSYVIKNDFNENVTLMRDHGGYLQGNEDPSATHEQLMNSAKESFLSDINSSFDIVQIDSSKVKDRGKLIDTTLDLLNFCESQCKNDLYYQINIESHSPNLHAKQNKDDLIYILSKSKMKDRIKFVSGNTGLCVFEDKNTGVIDNKVLSDLVWFTESQNKFFIQHNCDYLNSSQFMHLAFLGTPIVNVAPEYGSIETKVIMQFLMQNNLQKEYDEFCNIVVNSGKWKKWFNRKDYTKDDLVRVAGHYIFDDPFVVSLKKKYPEIEYRSLQTLRNTILCQLSWLGW